MLNRPVVDQVETEYGSFVVEELDYEGRQARVLFSGPLRAAQSGVPLDDNPRLLFDYNQRLLELAIQSGANNILILGGGTLTLPSAMLKYLPSANITVVEHNEKLIALAKKYFGYKPNKRLHIIVADAAEYMHNNQALYDLLLVDIYDNFTIPKTFRGVGFAKLLSRALKDEGVVATNCIAGLNGPSSLPLRQLLAAYARSIGPVRAVQADSGHMHWSPQNLIIISCKSKQINDHLLKGCVEIPHLHTAEEDYLS